MKKRIFEPTHPRLPFFSGLVEKGAGLFWVHQNGACCPAKLEGQSVETAQNARAAGLWKTINSNHTQMLFANLGFDSSDKVLIRDDLIQINRNLRKQEAMIAAVDASSHVAKQAIVNKMISILILLGLSSHAVAIGEQRAKDIGKVCNPVIEILERLLRTSLS